MSTRDSGPEALAAELKRLGDYPVFSRGRFEALTLGNAGLQRKLIESFMAQSGRMHDELLGAAVSGDAQFADAVHRLKGSCHFTAAERLMQMVHAVQRHGRTSTRQQRVVAAQAMVSGLQQLEQALSEILSEQRAKDP